MIMEQGNTTYNIYHICMYQTIISYDPYRYSYMKKALMIASAGDISICTQIE